MTDDSSNDLAWRASCYCLGELSESDAATFEALLAESQEAREAVASAMLLLGAIGNAHAEKSPLEKSVAVSLPQRTETPSTSGRSLWIAVGTIAAALLLAVTQLPTGSWSFLGTGLPKTSSERAELASIWLENTVVASANGTEDSLAVSEPESILEMEELTSDSTPPTWMVAALQQQTNDESLPDENSAEIDRVPVEN